MLNFLRVATREVYKYKAKIYKVPQNQKTPKQNKKLLDSQDSNSIYTLLFNGQFFFGHLENFFVFSAIDMHCENSHGSSEMDFGYHPRTGTRRST